MMAEVPGGASSRPRAQPAAAAGSSWRRSCEAKLASAMQLPAAIDKEGAEVVAPLQLFLEPQLADRGAAEELVDGIDSEARSRVARPCRHRGWTACGAADGVRSASAHAEHTCTGVVALWCFALTAMPKDLTHMSVCDQTKLDRTQICPTNRS